ncbi:hypothetical protein B5S31_g628 [[Candida] boidinii]|nr:hypothetical protein B5S31_g628 [[Candida] boidinii]OWB80499.1 hypothetical protein B5S32_g4782 [[Candida] boidinii]
MSEWSDLYSLTTLPKPQSTSVAPRGFDESVFKGLKTSANSNQRPKSVKNFELEKLKMKKAWEVAFSPAKNIPMNLIMMFFSPNGLQLIPIIMTLALFTGPVKDILNVNAKFDTIDIGERPSEYDRFILKMTYCLCSCGTILIGLYKLNSMGLIPNTSSDWLSWEETISAVEEAFFVH